MSNLQVFKVSNMNCNHCVKNIEKTLKIIKGIDKVNFNLEEKEITVYGKVSANVIIDSLEITGYEAVELI